MFHEYKVTFVSSDTSHSGIMSESRAQLTKYDSNVVDFYPTVSLQQKGLGRCICLHLHTIHYNFMGKGYKKPPDEEYPQCDFVLFNCYLRCSLFIA